MPDHYGSPMIGRKLYEPPELAAGEVPPVIAGSLVAEFAPSRYQPLLDRAGSMVSQVDEAVGLLREQGIDTSEMKISVDAFAELVTLVRDLAQAITEIR